MLLSRNISFARNISRLSQVLSQQAKLKQAEDEPKKVNNIIWHEELGINFRKVGLNDKALSHLVLMVTSKKKQQKEQQIIVEGKQLIKEAVLSKFKLNHLLFSHTDKIADVVKVMGKSTGHVTFTKVPQQDLTFYSALTTCPGLIGIFDKPVRIQPKTDPLPITVICDNIREPNNLGAVIRLANALPAEKVLLPKGCADPWDVKAIRGSSGSIFHMPTEDSLTWENIDRSSFYDDCVVLICDNDMSKYVPSTVMQYDEIPLELIFGKQIYLILGGETHGIGDEAMNFAMKRNWKVINIPLDPTVNSLNTSNALAITLFELRRKLTKGK